jgi:hypothetical protein
MKNWTLLAYTRENLTAGGLIFSDKSFRPHYVMLQLAEGRVLVT